MNTTQSVVLSPTMKEYYEKKLLENLKPKLCFVEHGQKKPIPKGNGKTVEFRKWGSLALATTPLTEGVPPTAKDLAMTSIKATVEQFGDVIETTDVLELTAYDDVIGGATEVLGDQAGETLDVVARNKLLNTPNEYNAGGRIDADAITQTDVLKGEDILKIKTIFKRSNVKPFDKHYLMFVSPEQMADIERDPLWIDVNKYNAAEKIYNGEVGKFRGFRFIDTTLVEPVENESGVNVYTGIAIGKNAYGIVDIAGGSKPKMFVKVPNDNDNDRGDPLNQKSTIGWKALFTAKVLYELAIMRVQSAATPV